MDRDKKSSIINNLNLIKKEIKDTKLVAVTKSVGLEEVKILKEAGHNIFGENRVSDTEEKVLKVMAEWHMIGHLQSNKVSKAVELFSWIDSVDSEKLAIKISEKCLEINKVMNILVQVNIGEEPQKSGIKPSEIFGMIGSITNLKGIKIMGLMAIVPFVDTESVRMYFKKMKYLYEKIKIVYPDLKIETLSMGMSNDYNIAIEEGSNMIRVGRKLFE